MLSLVCALVYFPNATTSAISALFLPLQTCCLLTHVPSASLQAPTLSPDDQNRFWLTSRFVLWNRIEIEAILFYPALPVMLINVFSVLVDVLDIA